MVRHHHDRLKGGLEQVAHALGQTDVAVGQEHTGSVGSRFSSESSIGERTALNPTLRSCGRNPFRQNCHLLELRDSRMEYTGIPSDWPTFWAES